MRASLKPRSCSAVEQEALHREFCALFEGFTGEFLDSRGVSEEAFGVALTAAMAERCGNTRSLLIVLFRPPLSVSCRRREGKISEGDSEGGSVEEIMNVLDEVADFSKWADSMRHMLWIETPD